MSRLWATARSLILSTDFDVAILGSGFAGSILARVLNRIGLRVVVLEKRSHPRFALGESSTPLAALSLERLSDRYGLEDLRSLAAWGRWKRDLAELRCGRKRGFTFYRHTTGCSYRNSCDNDSRLLVAASPDDEISDCQWLREDVDRYLIERAIDEGVEYVDQIEVRTLHRRPVGGWTIEGQRLDESSQLTTSLLVDATGRVGRVAREVEGNRRPSDVGLDTALIYGHFADVAELGSVINLDSALLSTGPYDDEWAAVHHLLDEGWMYVLRFDDGRVSAGISIVRDELSKLGLGGDIEPERIWSNILARYPSIAEMFAPSTVVRPVEWIRSVQHRRRMPGGDGWVALPHTYAFVDPLFSVGMAWSLRAVERLGLELERRSPELRSRLFSEAWRFDRYSALMVAEADQVERLVVGAYAAMFDFRLFAAHCWLYFSTVSFQEIGQRICFDSEDRNEVPWQGFLGGGNPAVERLFQESVARIERIRSSSEGDRRGNVNGFETWMREQISSWNVIGIGDPSRRNLYPVDLEALVAGAPRLGLTEREVESRLHLLRT